MPTDRRTLRAGKAVAAVLVWAATLVFPADDGDAARRLEEATVSFVRPGMLSNECDFNLQGGQTRAVRAGGEIGLRAADWFSCDLSVDDSPTLELIVTYGREEPVERAFALIVDGKKIAEERIPRRAGRGEDALTYVLYRLPERLVAGKKKVTVRFEAREGSETGAVYGIRVVRAPEHLE